MATAVETMEVDTHGEAMVTETPIRAEAARIFDLTITGFVRTLRFSWWELGGAAKAIRDGNLWKLYSSEEGEPEFHSFEDYINRRAQQSRATIYRQMTARIELDFVGEESAEKISAANAKWLVLLKKRCGPKKITKAVLQAAIERPEKQFGEFINDMMPGAAREEKKLRVSYEIDESLAKVLARAMKVAKWNAESEDDRDGLEELASYYLDGQHDGSKSGVSNRQAYEAAHGKRKAKSK